MGSRPSANVATFTPEPSARFAAWGVLGSSNAVCVVCRASGSSNGLLGSLGQRVCPLGVVAPARGDFVDAIDRALIGAGSCTIASGMTCLTAASRWSAVRSFLDTVAANALSAW